MAVKSGPRRATQKVSLRGKLIALLGLAIFCILVVWPRGINRGLDALNKATNVGLPRLPEKPFNLGLDLQGGAHLIFQADTRLIPAVDQADAVEGVRDVIERRVRGGLGVGEPLVQTTKVGSDYRIIIELPGVTDVNQAIKLIGETPVLEFKEANTEPPRQLTDAEQRELAAFNAVATQKALGALAELKNGATFTAVVQKYSEDQLAKSKGGDLGFIAAEQYPEMWLWADTHRDGQVATGTVKSFDGLNILQRLGERPGGKQVYAAHLLICYTGATGCTQPTYTKDEAKAKAEELKREATPANFAGLVKQYSTEPGAGDRGGDLGWFKKGQMVSEFETAVWEAATGTIIGPVETQFGWHLIHKKTEAMSREYQVARIFFKTKTTADFVPPADEWKVTGLSGKQLQRAEVAQDQRTSQVQVSLQFNDEGTKLFGDITGRNVGKPVAIFLDGSPISIPRVNEAILSGSAVISGSFTFQDAKLLAQRLNSGALPVPVELISQQKVDATLGADSLAKSFWAGLVGLALVMLFMIFYYRLAGFLSVVSLAVYAVLNLALFKLLGVTLTLSGIAAFILSVGMSVDTNVLVFERLKEELRLGKSLRASLEEAFVRSWPSIRDSHITTLISCVFLIWFGTGFITGFAVVLGTGVLVSLFTAITVTRTTMRAVFPWLPERGNWLVLGARPKGSDTGNPGSGPIAPSHSV